MNFKNPFSFAWLLLCICLSNPAQAQLPIDQCGNGEHHINQLQTNPAYVKSLHAAEETAQQWLVKNKDYHKDDNREKRVIPVVFHVIYNTSIGADQQVPYYRLLEQIEILNRDYNRNNYNKTNTRPIFDSIAGSMNLVFALATTDPNGNPTTGVTYTPTVAKGFDLLPTGSGFVALDSVKSTTGGGVTAWPTDKYFNVWVARLTYFGSEGLYGIATFPQSMPTSEIAGQEPPNPALEGVAMLYKTVGYNLTANNDTTFAGRTLTHEVGHYLGLRHIWGDSQAQQCDSSDYVFDTPQHKKNAGFLCNFNLNECSNEDPYWGTINPPNMVENYMDYSGDRCYNMFTKGQISRMTSFLLTDRAGLWGNEAAGGRTEEQFKAWAYTTPLSTCPENCDGKIEILAQHGITPYTYKVDDVAIASNMANGLCNGVHKIEVIDSNGDKITFDVYVGGSPYVKPTYTRNSTSATCYSCPDGIAKVNVTKGYGPFVIRWDVTPAVTGPELTGCTNGYYRFTIIDGCNKEYTDSVRVSSPTGISEYAASDFVLFPNPASNQLNLRFPESFKVEKATILNIAGAVVAEQIINRDLLELQFDVSTIRPGTYFIDVITNDHQHKTIPFTKL